MMVGYTIKDSTDSTFFYFQVKNVKNATLKTCCVSTEYGCYLYFEPLLFIHKKIIYEYSYLVSNTCIYVLYVCTYIYTYIYIYIYVCICIYINVYIYIYIYVMNGWIK